MKFYLSSYQIPTSTELFSLIGKEASEIKVGLIANAKDYYAPRARAFKVSMVTEMLADLGLAVEEIDLRQYRNPEVLSQDLSGFDLIWVSGGNSFCLRYEMKRSGFDAMIKKVLGNGVVYGGDSAGAVVVGNSLRSIELVDQPEFAEEIIWDGIGLVPHFILPHVNSPEIGELIQQVAELHDDDETMLGLTDAEALIIDGKTERIVGVK